MLRAKCGDARIVHGSSSDLPFLQSAFQCDPIGGSFCEQHEVWRAQPEPGTKRCGSRNCRCAAQERCHLDPVRTDDTLATMSTKTVWVVSHGPSCLDGAAAAAAVSRFHEPLPMRVRFASNQDVDAILRETDPESSDALWITDISWKDESTSAHLRQLIERGVEVHWIDHHKTAIERVKRGGYDLPFASRVVDDTFSAARLVFEHLAARDPAHARAPRFASFAPLIAMADDNDRWVQAIAGARDLGLVVRTLRPGQAYDEFMALDETLADTPAMSEARTRVAEELARNRRLAESTRIDQPFGEATLTTALCDAYSGELADEWGKSSPRTVFVFFDVRSGALSFRRSPDCEIDLSSLAERCGGGGHPAASGATLPDLGPLLGASVARALLTAIGEP